MPAAANQRLKAITGLPIIVWHKQNSNTESIYELEPSFETKPGDREVAKSDPKPWPHGETKLKEVIPSIGNNREAADATDPVSAHFLKSFPLGLVLQTCPQIRLVERSAIGEA